METKLNSVIHQELRLAVLSLLVGIKEADFSYLKTQTKSTQGNLSIQLKKLEEAKYITIKKQFNGNYPQTICSLTEQGRIAFEEYIEQIKLYLKLS